MKQLTYFAVSLLIGLTYTAPTGKSDKRLITENGFNENFLIYTAEYDVVNIVFPINQLNVNESQMNEGPFKPTIIFVLADYKNGQTIEKGMYIRKNGNVRKLLDYGRDAASDLIDRNVYIAAKDGLYTYNIDSEKVEKYGTVTDNLISISKVNGSDVLYVLSEDHIVYKVTNQGMETEKITEIGNPEQIVLDWENNLYYVANNHINIYGSGGIKIVENLPEPISDVKLIKPPILLKDKVPVAINNKLYALSASGTTVLTNSSIQQRPSAYSTEAGVFVYVGHNKKIYELNLIALIMDDIFEKVKKKINDTVDNIVNSLRSWTS